MKNVEAFGLYQNLTKGMFSELKGMKFVYALSRNQEILKRELPIIERVVNPKPKFIEYDTKRVELLKKYSEKDLEGNPVIKNENYIVNPEFKDEFNSIMDELSKEYDTALAERESDIAEYNKLLDSDINFELHKIKIENIPEDINKVQMDAILALLEE